MGKNKNTAEVFEVFWDYLIHIVIFSIIFILIALIAIGVHNFAKYLGNGFGIDQIILTGFQHVEMVLLTLDSAFFITSIVLTTLKSVKRFRGIL